jgi:small multidrug resistance family-3 protein
METIKSLFYFVLAGLFEIGGGYLVWLWVREGKSIGYALLGAAILVMYGLVSRQASINGMVLVIR